MNEKERAREILSLKIRMAGKDHDFKAVCEATVDHFHKMIEYHEKILAWLKQFFPEDVSVIEQQNSFLKAEQDAIAEIKRILE